MNAGSPLDQLAADVGERARYALTQGLAMHDAATILMATREFVEWAKVFQNGGGRAIEITDVISFFMSYTKALIDTQVRPASPEEKIPGLG